MLGKIDSFSAQTQITTQNCCLNKFREYYGFGCGKNSYHCNTLTDPWAVVIEFFDTVIADGTMATPRRPINLTNAAIFQFLFHPIHSNSIPSSSITRTVFFY